MGKKLPMAEVTVPNRICWECKHIYYNQGDTGYSEYSPGYDMTLECNKQYWKFDQFDDTLNQMRDKLMSAERCADFERRSDGRLR